MKKLLIVLSFFVVACLGPKCKEPTEQQLKDRIAPCIAAVQLRAQELGGLSQLLCEATDQPLDCEIDEAAFKKGMEALKAQLLVCVNTKLKSEGFCPFGSNAPK